MKIIKHKNLNVPEIGYGFSTRLGGKSAKPWNSLNCSRFVGDNEIMVNFNRKLFFKKLNLPESIQLNQQHGKKIVNVEEIRNFQENIEADAIVSKTNKFSVSVTTADCAPILFTSLNIKMVGAAHAGWRGAFSGITDNIIDEFIKNGSPPEKIIGIIGPCIGPNSYEVDKKFYGNALIKDKNSKKFFKQHFQDKFLFNLPGYIINRIKLKGLKNIYWTGHDTFANPKRFFSYRYSTKFENGQTGRMISAIAIK